MVAVWGAEPVKSTITRGPPSSTPDPDGELGDPAGGVVDVGGLAVEDPPREAAQDGVDHPAAGLEEPFDQRVEGLAAARPGHQGGHRLHAELAGADLGPGVALHQRPQADVGQDQLPDVAAPAAAADHPDRRDAEGFLPYLGGLRVGGPGHRAADVGPVAPAGHPARQGAVVEHRGEHPGVGVLDVAGQTSFWRKTSPGWTSSPKASRIDRTPGAQGVGQEGEVLVEGQHPALPVQHPRGQVPLLHQGRAGRAEEGRADPPGHAPDAGGEDRQVDGVGRGGRPGRRGSLTPAGLPAGGSAGECRPRPRSAWYGSVTTHVLPSSRTSAGGGPAPRGRRTPHGHDAEGPEGVRRPVVGVPRGRPRIARPGSRSPSARAFRCPRRRRHARSGSRPLRPRAGTRSAAGGSARRPGEGHARTPL